MHANRRSAIAKTFLAASIAVATTDVTAVEASGIAIAQVRADAFAPSKWDRTPIGSDKENPVVGVHLCVQPHTDPCAVRAEMRLNVQSAAQSSGSLEAILEDFTTLQAQAKQAGQEIVIAATNAKFRGHDAIKSATKGRYGSHIAKTVVSEKIVFETDGDFVNCTLTSEPVDYPSIEASFQDFCGSVDIAKLKNG